MVLRMYDDGNTCGRMTLTDLWTQTIRRPCMAVKGRVMLTFTDNQTWMIQRPCWPLKF